MKPKSFIVKQLQRFAVGINTIKLHPANTRKHNNRNIEAIKNSLTAYGQRKPIIVCKKTNIVEAGNGILKAARLLKWTEIAVIFVNDDIVMAKGYEIIENRTSDLSGWDLSQLKDSLEFLDTGEFNLEKMIGFKNNDIERLMTQFYPDQETNNNKNKIKIVQCPECGHKFKS